jgi:hypothetical protein
LRQKQRNEVVFRKLAEGGVIHPPLGIGNPPQCQPECQPLAPATYQYPPPVQADRLGNRTREPGQLQQNKSEKDGRNAIGGY